jgi:hypothetical protein
MSRSQITKLLLLSLSLFQACGFLRTEKYLLSAKMKPRWITIEYENPKCPPIKRGMFGQEFIIPESGFLCTSSSQYMGWHKRNYFLVDERGTRSVLKNGESIWRESNGEFTKLSFPNERQPCRIKHEQFFYGSKSDLTYDNPIMEDKNFLSNYHPECLDKEEVNQPTP